MADVLMPFVQAATERGDAAPYFHGHPHMWGDWGWGGMFFGPIAGILYLGLIVVAIVLVVRWLGGGHVTASAPREKTALEILEERFARGEIDKDEFEERRNLLSR